jgi:ATP-dependent Lon protease
LGRKFVRLSLGGVRDEAEIRGHRRTYVGAMPGRIIQSIRRAGSNNPVFILDEVDKIGADFRGDPASALLEVLDPEQNYSFSDHYLEVGFDLSKVMFITTANMLDTIPPALRDRMEVLQLPGYTEEEKIEIAFSYLLPRQLEAHGLTAGAVDHDPGSHAFSGCRLHPGGGLCAIWSGRWRRSVGAWPGRWPKALSPPGGPSPSDDVPVYLRTGQVFPGNGPGPPGSRGGHRPGLDAGGRRNPLHRSPEDARETANSSSPARWGGHAGVGGCRPELYPGPGAPYRREPRISSKDTDIHVHVPSGAIPKDGPSPGWPCSRPWSPCSGRPVKKGLAMTGEITLRGRVLPVGGIKDKVLAAHRAGIREVILPVQNSVDLEEIPESVRKDLIFHLVARMDEALEIAFPPRQETTVRQATA